MPTHVVFLSLIYPIVGIALGSATFGYDVIPLLFSACCWLRAHWSLRRDRALRVELAPPAGIGHILEACVRYRPPAVHLVDRCVGEYFYSCSLLFGLPLPTRSMLQISVRTHHARAFARSILTTPGRPKSHSRRQRGGLSVCRVGFLAECGVVSAVARPQCRDCGCHYHLDEGGSQESW